MAARWGCEILNMNISRIQEQIRDFPDFQDSGTEKIVVFSSRLLLISLIVAGIRAYQILLSNPVYRLSKVLWVVACGSLILTISLFFISTRRPLVSGLLGLLQFQGKKWVRILFSFGLILLVSVLILFNREYGVFLGDFWIRLFLILFTWIICWSILISAFPQIPVRTYLLPIMITGITWAVFRYMPWNLNYPFSTDWIETSWYFYSSFFFSKKVYGIQFAWPFLDIGRPFFFSPVFLLQHPSIAEMRIWESFLWFGTAILTSLLLIRRIHKSSRLSLWLLITWLFTSLLAGPVYFHLMLVAAIIIGGLSTMKFWQSLVVVIIATTVGGISRFNWIIITPLIACAIYILEVQAREHERLFKYYLRPMVWVSLGAVTGVLSFYFYMTLIGREETRLVSKFTSAYIWSKLLPNTSLPTGILFGLVIFSAAIWFTFFLYAIRHNIRRLRWLVLVFILAGLMLGGIIASMKVGGGFDLHNLDGFLIVLLLIGLYLLTGDFRSENQSRIIKPVPYQLLILIFVSPVLWLLINVSPIHFLQQGPEARELEQLQSVLAPKGSTNSGVLFISARHLLTFNLIKNVDLIPEYEMQELHEMAMAGNTVYLDKFREDLRTHKYPMIVIKTIHPGFYSSPTPAAEEQNAWNLWITPPILQYYRSILQLQGAGLEVYIPK
jgi:hypothetical protein